MKKDYGFKDFMDAFNNTFGVRSSVVPMQDLPTPRHGKTVDPKRKIKRRMQRLSRRINR